MDIAIVETGNGGELRLSGNDLSVQNGWGNMIYLAMFGGNIEGSTGEFAPTEIRNDFWGNDVLFPNDLSVQLNSETERTLKSVALGSDGRLKIQQAVQRDLRFMQDFADVTVEVTLQGVDKVNITIRVRELPKTRGTTPDAFRAFIFIWDSTLQQLGDFRIQDFNDDFFV